jgi:hypothetical protein
MMRCDRRRYREEKDAERIKGKDGWDTKQERG